MGENNVHGLTHTILHTFETAYAEKQRKCLLYRALGKYSPMQYDHYFIF